MEYQEWMDDGRCHKSIFPAELWFSYKAKEKKKAQSICNLCPVKDKCLDWALSFERTLDDREIHGIFGGMTNKDRIALLKVQES